MCSHEKLLDDFITADVICTECGLIMDRIIGYSNEGRQRYRFNDSDIINQEELYERNIGGGENAILYRKYELLNNYLAVLHLDNEHVLNRVSENYEKIFGSRTNFKYSTTKRDIAIAFSIANTLNRLSIPRPVGHIAQLCNVDVGLLLNIPKNLNFTKIDFEKLKESDYVLDDISPTYFIDTVCAYLGIKFNLASEMITKAEEVEWKFEGRQAHGVAAAIIVYTLRKNKKSKKENDLLNEVCDALGCLPRTVNDIIKHI